jgi:hypothetical protein
MRMRSGLRASSPHFRKAGAKPGKVHRVASSLVLAAMGLVLTAVTAKAVLHELDLRSSSIESARWTEVAGTIVSSTVQVQRGKSTTYWPEITYRYQVDGRSFSGHRPLFSSHTSESTAYDLVDRYRPGNSAIVWIRPGDPSTSVLVRQSWNDWFSVGLLLLLGTAFGVLTATSTVASVSAIRTALRSHAPPPEPPLEDVEARAGVIVPSVLGTLAEATDTRVVFTRRRGALGWRVGLAAAGAIAGPAIAPLAPMAWWVAALAIVVPAASLFAVYAALPELALAVSTLAPMRFRLRVERGDVDPYRGEPVYSGAIDGREFGPESHRALLDVRVGRLVAYVLVAGAKASIVAYAVGQRAAAAALQPIDTGADRGRPASMADLGTALATVLHVSKTAVRPGVRLAPLSWWPLGLWFGARAAIYGAVAALTPLDATLGLFFAVGCGLTMLALEVGLVLAALFFWFVPPLEALGREVRGHAQG